MARSQRVRGREGLHPCPSCDQGRCRWGVRDGLTVFDIIRWVRVGVKILPKYGSMAVATDGVAAAVSQLVGLSAAIRAPHGIGVDQPGPRSNIKASVFPNR